jgi:hypothetical protein
MNKSKSTKKTKVGNRKAGSRIFNTSGGSIQMPSADGSVSTHSITPDERLPKHPFSEDAGRLAVTRVRLCYATALSTNVAGNIVNAQFSTGQVFSLPALGWTSYAARFVQYRVVGMRYRLFPHYNTSFDSTLTSTLGTIAICPYYNGNPPSTLNQILLGPDMRLISTAKGATVENIPEGFLNAGIWQDTGSLIPLINQYGLSLYGFNSVALAANQIIFDALIEWIVEFRDPQ